MQDRCVIAGDVDQEVVFVKGLELDLHVSRLHDLVDLAVLLSTNELAVLIGELDLEANLVVEALYAKAPIRHNAKVKWRYGILTLTISKSRSMMIAERTSCSRPCISKHIPLKTTSAPVA